MDNSKDKERAFEQYREQMHPDDGEKRGVVPRPTRPVAIAWAIFMIIVYVGMGVLLLINKFNWSSDWSVPRYVVGIALIAYGVYRAYRSWAGTDYYTRRN